MDGIVFEEILSIECQHLRGVRIGFCQHRASRSGMVLRRFSGTVWREVFDDTWERRDRRQWNRRGACWLRDLIVKYRGYVEVVSNLICGHSEKQTIFECVGDLPVPTIVHTLVSPMSTCQSAPEDAPVSLDEPRRPDDAEPAELGLRRPFGPVFLAMPPPLDVERFCFLTRPPSFD